MANDVKVRESLVELRVMKKGFYRLLNDKERYWIYLKAGGD